MDVDQIFKKEGPLSKYLKGYNPRPGQVALAKAVESSLRDGQHLLAEGPTGTGKSLAYGIPAAVYALTRGRSVVIATANIALQEQLAKKDLPLIKNLMADLELGDLKFFSRKGLGNYVCLFKLEELIQNESEPWAKALRRWVSDNDQGDKEELPVDYHEKWFNVAANRYECHHNKCRFYERCYAFRSRQMDVDDGCLVVTNYHLLYADCLVREATGGKSRLLPEYSVVVMDEAHEAVEIARGFQGFDLSMSQVWWAVKRFKKLIKRPDTTADNLAEEGRRFYEELALFHKAHDGKILTEPLGFGHRLITAFNKCGAEARNHSKDMPPEEKAQVSRLADLLYRRAYEFKSACYGFKEDDEFLLFSEADEDDENLEELTGDEEDIPEVGGLEDDAVYYTEASPTERGLTVKLCKKVIEVQGFLRQHFLDEITLIGTSATLSTHGNFNFVAKELGLESDEYSSLIAPSPFDSRRMLVVVPADMPTPKERDLHIKAVSRGIEQVVTELGGRSMALFTSYRSLNAVSEYLRRNLKGVTLLIQGEMPRGKIVDALKQDERSLILATASFWQGVDIPGRALSCLFIEKFPFAPPTDPVMCYMESKAERKGSDRFSAFFSYSIPKAVISLKQGVGRLIRTETDYGAVVMFDNRLETESYGTYFEAAFPDDHYRADSLRAVAQFIQAHDKKAST